MRSAYPPDNETTGGRGASSRLSLESDLVFARLFLLPQYGAARSVGLFLSMPHGEIRTDRAICRIAASSSSLPLSSPHGGSIGGDGGGRIDDNRRKVLYFPQVGLDFKGRDMDMVRCDCGAAAMAGDSNGDAGASFYDGWPHNRWGIPEPPVAARSMMAWPGDIDLLVVPGLAFDAAGR